VYGSVLANIYTAEGSVNGSVVVTFPWRPRKTIVTNDSSLTDMVVTIKGTSLTLKPTETLTLLLIISDLTITTSALVSYRVWGFG
jgi:hypothetical protein